MMKKLTCFAIALLSTISAVRADDFESSPFMVDVKRRLKRAWFPPKGQENAKVGVVFKIHKDGRMTDLRVHKPSGNALADCSAHKAVENAAPFRPLPTSIEADWISIRINFDRDLYNFNPHKALERALGSGSGTRTPTTTPTIVSSASEFKFAADDPYIKDLRRRIRRSWFPPKGGEFKLVLVSFHIHRDGLMSDLRIEKSSDSAGATDAALHAVSNASPFRPLPSDVPDSVLIKFRFPDDAWPNNQ